MHVSVWVIVAVLVPYVDTSYIDLFVHGYINSYVGCMFMNIISAVQTKLALPVIMAFRPPLP